MKLAGILLKAGIATAGTGIYLLTKRFFKKVKKTTNDAAEKVEKKVVKPKAKRKATTTKPRQKRTTVPVVNA